MSEVGQSGSVFCSSVAHDAWVDLPGDRSFQSWYFDAISDDGREVLVIEFIDNYILSSQHDLAAAIGSKGKGRHPLVRISYSVDGRRVLDSGAEFSGADFIQCDDSPGCTIGRSGFKLDNAAYGSGYMLTIDVAAFAGRRIKVQIEWLSIESDLRIPDGESSGDMWNVSVPRADVSGRIDLVGRTGKVRRTYHFRGTGYHDHIKSSDLLYRDLSSRVWGRAHFSDTTLIFERLGGVQNHSAPGRFILVRDREIVEYSASCLATEHQRDRWGIKVPGRLAYLSPDGVRIRIKPRTLISSALSDVKYLSEITLGLNDGKPRRAFGIVQFVDPMRTRNRVLRLISELRTGRSDRSPWF
jgi:carotenoid 1,2-hydratase